MKTKEGYRILIVDDEKAIAEMCKIILTNLGYAVVGLANTYQSAIEQLESSKPDLVILDIDLKEDKSGIDLANYIKEKLGIPYLFLSSYADMQTVTKAAKTVPEAYLIKPFTEEDLFTTIEVIRSKKEINCTVRLNTGNEVVTLSANEISMVKSDNNYIEVYANHKKHLVRSTLESFLNENDYSNFVRIHRSYVVNLLRVNSFSSQHVIVGDYKCPISRTYKQELFQRFA